VAEVVGVPEDRGFEPVAAPASAATTPTACPRCHGRLLRQGMDGDLACFSCGHVVYDLAPLPIEVGRRAPSHGGWRLS
jgi:hypothetical protein